jgi:hypothetical protein
MDARKRLEELRTEIREERISYGEIAELSSLVEFIEDGDVELLEWAGVPEQGCEICGIRHGRTGSNVCKKCSDNLPL